MRVDTCWNCGVRSITWGEPPECVGCVGAIEKTFESRGTEIPGDVVAEMVDAHRRGEGTWMQLGVARGLRPGTVNAIIERRHEVTVRAEPARAG